MTITKQRMTEEEFMRLPEEGYKYELVEGEVKLSPAGHIHDIRIARLTAKLYPFTEERGYLAGSQAGFRMKNGNIRCPDLAFTSRERLPGGLPSTGFEDFAPDLCVEVISPSEDMKDSMRKVEEYFESGAQLVWHFFSDPPRVKVFTSPTEWIELGPEEELSGDPVLPEFRCRVADLMEIRRT